MSDSKKVTLATLKISSTRQSLLTVISYFQILHLMHIHGSRIEKVWNQMWCGKTREWHTLFGLLHNESVTRVGFDLHQMRHPQNGGSTGDLLMRDRSWNLSSWVSQYADKTDLSILVLVFVTEMTFFEGRSSGIQNKTTASLLYHHPIA